VVLFDGMDKLQHLLWRYIDRAYEGTLSSAEERRVRQGCLGYYREMDRLLAQIADLAGPEATIVIASDHGFGPQTGTFFVNAWLEQRGYLAWADGQAPVASRPGELGVEQLARHVYLLDWDETRAYVPTPSGNGVYLVVAKDERGYGIPEADYAAWRDRLAEELRRYTDPASGESVVSRVWAREEAYDGPYAELAPDLTLELRDGGLVSILASDVPFKPRAEPSGTHRPQGIFGARGPELREGTQLESLSILDVAPLLLYSLGLPIPEALEGKVPLAALRPESLEARPVEKTGATVPEAPEPTFVGPALDEEAEAELLRRLRALGYVE
jgi:predicted AlkP superfamily phosphohydrolase/phosphomutase